MTRNDVNAIEAQTSHARKELPQLRLGLAAPDPASLLPVPGVELGIASAGIKKPGRKDVLVMRIPHDSEVVGVFTQNRFCAAPVTVCKEHLHND